MSRRSVVLFFKIAAGVFFIVLTIVIFCYPFPVKCAHCSIFYKLGYVVFSIFGLTAFFLPVLGVLILLRRIEKAGKLLKLSLKLWAPVLLNLALVRELLEMELNIGGIFSSIFAIARDNNVDFLLILIPVIGFDLLVLFLFGVNLPRLWRTLTNIEEEKKENENSGR